MNGYWQLFLDDERYPPDPIKWKDEWKIARNVDDAMWYIKTYGIPGYMSLDHDLGSRKMNGMDFCKTLWNYIMDNDIRIPSGFRYYVHSQNPVGAENMNSYMKKALEVLE